MKRKLLLILSLLFSFALISNTTNASVYDKSEIEIPYCSGKDCGLNEGIEQVRKTKIDGMIKEGKASEYIQRILIYLLGFLKLVSIIILIYAGFNMLTAGGDEEKAKKSKTIMLYAIIGVAIIFLAGPITNFVIDLFTKS